MGLGTFEKGPFTKATKTEISVLQTTFEGFHNIIAGRNSSKTNTDLLNSFSVTRNQETTIHNEFENFVNNKILDKSEKTKFLWICNKLIENKEITINDIVKTIKIIGKHRHNNEANDFFYCLFIIKNLRDDKSDGINLNSLELLLSDFKKSSENNEYLLSSIELLNMYKICNKDSGIDPNNLFF